MMKAGGLTWAIRLTLSRWNNTISAPYPPRAVCTRPVQTSNGPSQGFNGFWMPFGPRYYGALQLTTASDPPGTPVRRAWAKR